MKKPMIAAAATEPRTMRAMAQGSNSDSEVGVAPGVLDGVVGVGVIGGGKTISI